MRNKTIKLVKKEINQKDLNKLKYLELLFDLGKPVKKKLIKKSN